MISNIKQLWSRMLPETKRETIERLKMEFALISTVFVRQTWISGGGIPIEKQKRVLELFEEIVKNQERATLSLTRLKDRELFTSADLATKH